MSQHQQTNTPPIPKRPLTKFNLFTKLERNYIVQEDQKRASNPPGASNDCGVDPYLATRPARYRDVVLPSNWFVVKDKKAKRQEHKNHGVISFLDLTKTVADRWKAKATDDETVMYCNMIAAAELVKYKKIMAEYKEKYGEEATNAQKKTYKKRNKKDRIGILLSVSEKDGKDDNFGKSGCSQPDQVLKGSAVNDEAKVHGIHQKDEKNDNMMNAGCSQLDQVQKGLAADDETKYAQNRASAKELSVMKMPRDAKSDLDSCSDENNSLPSNSDESDNFTRSSDSWSDDTVDKMALVGNNPNNVLYGEELEKAFDSDSSVHS